MLARFPAMPESAWIEIYSNRSLPAFVRALGADDPDVPYVPGVQLRDDQTPPVDADLGFVRIALTWPCPGLTRAAFFQPLAAPPPGVGVALMDSPVIDHVMRAARNTAMDPALMMAIAEIESKFSPAAKAQTSTATGLYQFVEHTWLQAMRSFGARHGHPAEAQALASGLDGSPLGQEKLHKILELRADPYLSAALAGEMLARDSARVAKTIRRRLTAGEVYMIHLLGVGDASRFLWALSVDPNYPAAALFPRPAFSNPSIFYERRYGMFMERSLAGVYMLLDNMVRWRAQRYSRLAMRQTTRVAYDAR